jgi:anti-sigma regulatory factor (Ser/Thr protein kinase)
MAIRDPDLLPESAESGRSVELSIPSRMESLSLVDCLVQGIAVQMELDEEVTIEVATSVIEAGTNAIQHGHFENDYKHVHFRFLLGETALEVWVHDHGPGFELDTVLNADPTRPEDLLKARGRGIFIMRAMMDLVEFEIRPGEGTTVHLVKNLRRGNGSSAPEGA